MSTPNNKPPNWDYDLPTFMRVASSMPRKPPKSVQFAIEPANGKKTEDLADDDGGCRPMDRSGGGGGEDK